MKKTCTKISALLLMALLLTNTVAMDAKASGINSDETNGETVASENVENQVIDDSTDSMAAIEGELIEPVTTDDNSQADEITEEQVLEPEESEVEEEEVLEEDENMNDPDYQKILEHSSQDKTAIPSSASQITHQPRFDSYQKIYGIDVSKWQGSIDWPSVKASGVGFSIIRAGYRGSRDGALYVDDCLARNLSGAKTNGVEIGLYFFTQAVNTTEAVQEANYVLSMLRAYPNTVTLPIYIDIEDLAGGRLNNAGLSIDQKTAICAAFCETIKAGGYTPGVYANKNWLNTQIRGAALGQNYQIWLANYNTYTDYTGNFQTWQFSDCGSVRGINGNVDLDVLYLIPSKVPSNLKQKSATTDSITAKWTGVESVSGYQLTVCDSKGSVLGQAVTIETEATVAGLQPGKTYYVKVRSYTTGKSTSYSDYSSAVNMYTITNPVANLIQKKCGLDSAKITWTPTEGAKGYVIEKYNAKNNKFTEIGTIQGTEYSLTGLKKNSVTTITVKPYILLNGSKKKYGDRVAIDVRVKPSQVTDLMATTKGMDTINLSWKSVKSATGYVVAVCNSKGKVQYETVVNTNSAVINGLNSGVTYRFKVKAYLDDSVKVYYGSYSTLATAKTLSAAPTISATKMTSKSITVAWPKVKGAEGYRIQRYDAATGKYKTLAAVTASTRSYTVTGLSRGKLTNISVQSFITINGKRKYSSRSNLLSTASAPKSVSGVNVFEISTNSVSFAWGAVSNATGYTVTVCNVDGTIIKTIDVLDPSVIIGELSADTEYGIKVKAFVTTLDGVKIYGTDSEQINVRTTL